jgi:hypothetical protein
MTVHPRGGQLKPSNKNPLSKHKVQQLVIKSLKMFPHLTREQVLHSIKQTENAETWDNKLYQVHVHRGVAADSLVHVDELKGKCTWLSIKRLDRKPVNSWQDLQTIKNRLCGTNCDAIQMFPKESRLVNTANQYHLIVTPPEINFPFGWTTRAVCADETYGDLPMKQTYNGEQNNELSH